MVYSECKKCHKPLKEGKKCDACKQQEKNKIKTIGVIALSTVGITISVVVKGASILKKIK